MQSLCPEICEFLIVVLSSIHALADHSLKEPYRKQCTANLFLYIPLKGICVCASSMCTFSCKCNTFLIWTNSCFSPSSTLSAEHSHAVLPSTCEDRDVEKRLELPWCMLNLRLHLGDLLPGIGWWHKGSLLCSYFWHLLHLKPNNRYAQNMFFWRSFSLSKLIYKQTTKYWWNYRLLLLFRHPAER